MDFLKVSRISALFFVYLLGNIFFSPAAQAQGHWYLPQDFDTHNISVRFEVDSTWHMVEGDTSGLVGRVWLKDPADYHSVQADLELPVALFNTHNQSRDKRLRQVMHADTFPKVHFALSEARNICDPNVVKEGYVCDFLLLGALKIRDVEKSIEIPARVAYDKDQKVFFITGNVKVKWQEFGIEDPSIFIAKVDPLVDLIINLSLRERTPKA